MNTWTPEQTRMLSALGYTLYLRAGSESAPSLAVSSQAQAPTTPGESPADRASDPLWRALCRAANGAGLEALTIDLAALRRRPEQKRALWPQLRSLRRAGGPSGAAALPSVAETRDAGSARRSR